MKRMRFLVFLMCSGVAAFWGTQFAFAAAESSKAELLLPVVEMVYAVLIKQWWICGAMVLIGAVYVTVFILRRSQKILSKAGKEAKPE